MIAHTLVHSIAYARAHARSHLCSCINQVAEVFHVLKEWNWVGVFLTVSLIFSLYIYTTCICLAFWKFSRCVFSRFWLIFLLHTYFHFVYFALVKMYCFMRYQNAMKCHSCSRQRHFAIYFSCFLLSLSHTRTNAFSVILSVF